MRQKARLFRVAKCLMIALSSDAFSTSSQIHQTIRELKDSSLHERYETTKLQVLEVLHCWVDNEKVMNEWRSIVYKTNLCHEVEESIVALHHLQEFGSRFDKYVAVDACCGKGLFSTLLSYLAPKHYPNLQRIVLLDKDLSIDWNHIHDANKDYVKEDRPFLELWAGSNLHEHDQIVAKLSSFDMPLAITGIHLCKTLSPALVGIANAMRAPYLCLAPCCLPRSNQLLSIPQFETPMQRNARLGALEFRAKARERRRSRCYVCRGEHHVKDCPERVNYASADEWNQAVENSLLALPCWNCGKTGHRRQDCTEHVALQQLPHQEFSMTLLSISPKPFEDYCKLLSKYIESSTTRVVDSGLTSTSSEKQQHGNNWNRDRKAIFIIASQ